MTNTKIQVREYVRTIDGYIRKVTQYNEKGSYDCLCWGACMVDKDYKHSKGISLKKIKKHSFNLIDLIEVGDYVNGMQVVEKYENSFAFEYEGQLFSNKQIKTIVTKEQFKSMEYEAVQDDD